MAKIQQLTPARFLGTNIPNPKVLGSKVEEIIETLNDITNTDSSIVNSVVKPFSTVAINSTGVATAAQIATGNITSTSAAPVSLTLPTATLLAAQLKATAGSMFSFVVDNTGGANIITIVTGSGITVLGTIVITGSATLTVAATSLAVFELIFTSTTAAKLVRAA